jgi:hypothetical protein
VIEVSTVSRLGSNNYSSPASLLRDPYASYFMGEGAESVQLKMIDAKDQG